MTLGNTHGFCHAPEMKPRPLVLISAGIVAAGVAWFAWPRAKMPGNAGPTPRQLLEELLPPLPSLAEEENGWVPVLPELQLRSRRLCGW